MRYRDVRKRRAQVRDIQAASRQRSRAREKNDDIERRQNLSKRVARTRRTLSCTKFRSSAQWFRSVDVLRQFDSWCMVPSHWPPLCGEDDVQTLLRNFRDAIQFTHDQTIRHMYQAKTPDTLVQEVVLPDYLIDDLDSITTAAPDMDPKDYLRKFYGSVPQAVRARGSTRGRCGCAPRSPHRPTANT